MKNSFTNKSITTISKGIIFFSMVLIGLLFSIIYHSISSPKTDMYRQISSITTLPSLSLSVGAYERRIPSYEHSNPLYPDIEAINYLGFVYDK